MQFKLYQGLEAIRTDIRKLTMEFMKIAELKHGEVSEKLAGEWQATLQALGSNVEALSRELRASTNEFAASVDQTVKDNPLRSLAVAAGFGVIIGALWRK